MEWKEFISILNDANFHIVEGNDKYITVEVSALNTLMAEMVVIQFQFILNANDKRIEINVWNKDKALTFNKDLTDDKWQITQDVKTKVDLYPIVNSILPYMDKLKTYSVGEDFGLSTTKFDSGNSSLNVHINLKKSNYTIFQIGPAHNQLYVDISVSRAIMVDKILSILKRYDLDVIYYDSMDKQKVKDNLTKANTEIKTFLKTFFDQYIQDQLSYALTMIKEFIFDIKG